MRGKVGDGLEEGEELVVDEVVWMVGVELVVGRRWEWDV